MFDKSCYYGLSLLWVVSVPFLYQNPPQIVSTLSECLLLIGSNNLGKSFPRWKQLVLVLMYDGLWISELWC